MTNLHWADILAPLWAMSINPTKTNMGFVLTSLCGLWMASSVHILAIRFSDWLLAMFCSAGHWFLSGGNSVRQFANMAKAHAPMKGECGMLEITIGRIVHGCKICAWCMCCIVISGSGSMHVSTTVFGQVLSEWGKVHHTHNLHDDVHKLTLCAECLELCVVATCFCRACTVLKTLHVQIHKSCAHGLCFPWASQWTSFTS